MWRIRALLVLGSLACDNHYESLSLVGAPDAAPEASDDASTPASSTVGSGGVAATGGAAGASGGTAGAGASGGAGGSVAPTIACLDEVCADGDICCVLQQGEPRTVEECMPEGACSQGVPVACDDYEDCEGDALCCGYMVGGQYVTVSCKVGCPGTVEEPFVCHFPEALCPFGKTCEDSSWLPEGYGRCLPQP